MTSHCAGTVRMREESDKKVRFKTTAEDGERGAAVTCDGRLFHRRAAATGNALSPTVDRQECRFFYKRLSLCVKLKLYSVWCKKHVQERTCTRQYAQTCTFLIILQVFLYKFLVCVCQGYNEKFVMFLQLVGCCKFSNLFVQ